MRIFVTGATGYLGFHAATALRRAGHEVLGLTRSPERAVRLARHEIEPVIGSLQEPAGWLKAAASAAVAVHAAVDYDADVFAVDRLAVESLLGAGPGRLIYTSGCWVYGPTGRRAVDETTPVAPVARVRLRPELERLALSSSSVAAVVLRPGCVYGEEGGMFGDWFEPLSRGQAPTIIGDGTNRWTVVHVHDLADAYVRAVESPLAGEIFNVSDRSRETVTAMVEAAAAAAGFTGRPVYQSVADAAVTLGSFAECLAIDQHLDSSKAVRLLGWQPRFGGFADQAGIFYRTWLARRG